jgi:hypothetical protein
MSRSRCRRRYLIPDSCTPSFPAFCSPHLRNPNIWVRLCFARSSRRCVPMDPSSASSDRPRKRRAINACVNCRTSKVRCDGKRPCQRCGRNDAVCEYHDAVRDEPGTLRIERLEAEVAALRYEMNHRGSGQMAARTEQASTPMSSGGIGERAATPNAVNAGLITWEQAALWFQRYDSSVQREAVGIDV